MAGGGESLRREAGPVPVLLGVGPVVRAHLVGVVRVDAKRHRFELRAGEGGVEGEGRAAGRPPPQPLRREAEQRREGFDLGRLWAPLCEGEEGLHGGAVLAEAAGAAPAD